MQDDGELYDEFGNLKKKFRAKMQQAEAGRGPPGAGRAGWEVEELGIVNFTLVNSSMIYICIFIFDVIGKHHLQFCNTELCDLIRGLSF